MFWCFCLLVFISILCFCCLIDNTVKVLVRFDKLTSVGYNWLVKLDYDFITCMVLTMLGVCFCYVWFYTRHYFQGDYAGKELNKIIFIFVCVMARLVSTGDFLLTLIFWEYLGVVRFFLILFYMKYLRLRSSIVTLVSSRFGDVALFLLVTLWRFIGNKYYIGLVYVLLVILTKSARFPFISWLLEAMRAPTPVSSLVHSSTLVAAGVWFSMRYDITLISNDLTIFSILLILTIMITGICCFYFLDLKKIVALSTCNNIAWCVFYLIFGDVALSLFQLVSHGVSKCMLFMLVGDIMSGSSGSQASNGVYSTVFYKNWNIFSLFCVVTGLSGIPFIGVFFTKHFLICSFTKIIRVTLTLILLFCVFLSYFYSFRFCRLLIKSNSSNPIGIEYFFKTQLIIFFWLCIKFFIAFYLDELSYMGYGFSVSLIVFQTLSLLAAIYFYNRTILSNWRRRLFGSDNVVEYLYKLFMRRVKKVRIFFARWDQVMINRFYKIGLTRLNSYKRILIKILILLILWIFMCCSILL